MLHLVVALILVLNFNRVQKNVGLNQPKIVNSYLLSSKALTMQFPQKTAAKKSITTLPLRTNGQIAAQNQSTTLVSNVSQQENLHPSSPQLSMSGQQTNELLVLLHQAIQEHQTYPPSALEMERQGRVTVGFTLLKNGDIMNLRIVKSSGTNSLDEAGLAAVQMTAPFQEAEKYLSLNSQDFVIGVVFELPENLD